MKCKSTLAMGLLWVLCATARAGEVHVAVASNFTRVAQKLSTEFTAQTGHRALLSFGSTGKLYTQIIHGAPFQVFLAADADRPLKLEQEGRIAAGSRFTYALGHLALYSRDPGRVDDSPAALAGTDSKRVAIANPATAPYGAAAVEVLKALKLYERLRPRLVLGENIAQAFHFTATGNAALGLIAQAQLRPGLGGSWWLVPPQLHSPIRQQAVRLKKGSDSPAARAFMLFLRQATAQKIILAHGYGTEHVMTDTRSEGPR